MLVAPIHADDPVVVLPESLAMQDPKRSGWAFIGRYLVSTYDPKIAYLLGPFVTSKRDTNLNIHPIHLYGPGMPDIQHLLEPSYEVNLLDYTAMY